MVPADIAEEADPERRVSRFVLEMTDVQACEIGVPVLLRLKMNIVSIGSRRDPAPPLWLARFISHHRMGARALVSARAYAHIEPASCCDTCYDELVACISAAGDTRRIWSLIFG